MRLKIVFLSAGDDGITSVELKHMRESEYIQLPYNQDINERSMRLCSWNFIYLFIYFLYFPQKMRSTLQYNIKKKQLITLTIKTYQILIQH